MKFSPMIKRGGGRKHDEWTLQGLQNVYNFVIYQIFQKMVVGSLGDQKMVVGLDRVASNSARTLQYPA